MGVKSPAQSPSTSPDALPDPAEKDPLSPRERVTSLPLRRQGVRGTTPASSPTENRPVAVSRHSRAGGNPAGQGAGGIKHPSPSIEEEPAPSEGRGWDGGEEPNHPQQPQPAKKSTSQTTTRRRQPRLPHRTPEPRRRTGNLQLPVQIESGEYEPGEITIRQPTPEDWKSFELNLAEPEGTRRIRRRPPPPQPTGRHIEDAHHPQPLTNQSLPPWQSSVGASGGRPRLPSVSCPIIPLSPRERVREGSNKSPSPLAIPDR